MPITLKETINIRIINSHIINGKREEPKKTEKAKVMVVSIQAKSKKVLRNNG